MGFYTGLSVYRSFVSQTARIRAERLAFARLLANLINTKDKHLVYMDETTYSTVQSKAKSWSFRSTPVLHPKNNRQMRVTVFGACGPALVGGLVVKLAPSTNSVDYCSFLLQVKEAIKPAFRNVKLIMCQDNASAHTSRVSKAFAASEFHTLNIPVMSCEFNSIEKIWHATKTYYNKRLMSAAGEVDELRFRQLVLESL